MKCIESFQNGTAILTFSGRFEFNTRETFQASIKKAQQNRIQTIVLDLKDLAFADSAALVILKLTQDSLKQHGATLVLAGPPQNMMEQLQKLRITNFIPTVSSVEKALATTEIKHGHTEISTPRIHPKKETNGKPSMKRRALLKTGMVPSLYTVPTLHTFLMPTTASAHNKPSHGIMVGM